MNDFHKVNLEEEKETLLITLLAKALDSRSKNTILNDRKAEEILKMIDYDFEKLNNFGNDVIVIRAKQFDTWLKDFIEGNDNVTVLNLGCVLDTRVSRLNPQSKVLWFDVDYPDVIDVRKLFFSTKDGYEMISSSVTELDWLEHIPNDRPVMIIAEGLLEYLTEVEVKTLLDRMTTFFTHGQIAFDVMNSFAIKSGKERLKETTGAIHKWIVDDVHDVDKLNTKLTKAADLSVFKSTYIHNLPLKVRLMYATLCLIPSFRNMMRLLLYKF
ncbi:MAG TPA: class I SAM-dependent methyltransferase [Bacillota bacterium]|nr:class I SAM-dependent methyltransferase [Bacillota bacterium]